MSIADLLSDRAEIARLTELLPDSAAPFSIADLETAAQELGFDTLAIEWPSNWLVQFPCPAILHVRHRGSPTADHFIICYGAKGDELCVADFPDPPVLLKRRNVLAASNGVVLYVAPKNSGALRQLRLLMWVPTVVFAFVVVVPVFIAGVSIRRMVKRRHASA